MVVWRMRMYLLGFGVGGGGGGGGGVTGKCCVETAGLPLA